MFDNKVIRISLNWSRASEFPWCTRLVATVLVDITFYLKVTWSYSDDIIGTFQIGLLIFVSYLS